ncbi:MAG: L,D-transpeptidase [Deltaproteobacteria bacterium]|nr:L,D-transpeptidase [Deltaproteobacteria bacterium]
MCSTRLLMLTSAIAFAGACADTSTTPDDPEQGSYEGVDEDADPTIPMDDGKADVPRYAIPQGLPVLVDPEIIVSLEGLTVHLFDRATGFTAVYPAGVGVKNSQGRSITPTGHFSTGLTEDPWFYVPRRTNPDYFGGFPFLRLTAQNSAGANTYALHGPITSVLQRGYVSHGCVRMASKNVIDLFWMVKGHLATPVTIQQEIEYDAAGKRVDVGRRANLWAVGEDIEYGASVGPRPTY